MRELGAHERDSCAGMAADHACLVDVKGIASRVASAHARLARVWAWQGGRAKEYEHSNRRRNREGACYHASTGSLARGEVAPKCELSTLG